jgi:hypothetical protein
MPGRIDRYGTAIKVLRSISAEPAGDSLPVPNMIAKMCYQLSRMAFFTKVTCI